MSNRKILTVACISFLLLLFHTPFERILSNTIVNYGLSFIKSSVLNDLLFISLGAFSLLFLVIKIRKYRSSIITSISLMLLSIAYITYRIEDQTWNFTSFLLNDRIKYADILLVVTLTSILLSIPKRKPNRINKSFISDEPLGNSGTDKLDYANHAQNLANQILSCELESAFAIGINAPWGVGKTSYIDLIKRNLKSGNIIEINFNPWNSHTPKAIIQDFFDTLQDAIKPFHSSLPKQFLDYSNKLVALNENQFTRTIQISADFIFESESLNTLYSKINSSLRQINRKIIIYIDDVDRLDKEEVVEVLRLIRNTANFYNTFFIVAFDREYVINSLEDYNHHNKERFLEKIFQIEVTLPYFEKSKLSDQLANNLVSKLPQNLHKTVFNDIIGSSSNTKTYLYEWLENMRDVTRLTNSILLNYNSIQGEVNFNDLFRLELIRLKYPLVYKLLFTHKSKFFEYSNGHNEEPTYILRRSKAQSNNILRNEEYETELQIHLNTEFKFKPHEIEKIVTLLRQIFKRRHASKEESNIHLSVIYQNSFDKYFMFKLPDGSLSEIDFERARSLSLTDFESKISAWVDNNLETDLQRRFEKITKFENKAEYEKIIRAIFHLANQKTKKSHWFSRTLVGYNGDDLHKKIYNYHQNIKKNETETKNHKEFVLDLFKKAKAPFEFESDYARFENSQFESKDYKSPFPLAKQELKEISLNYFNTYCDSINEFTDNIWDLFHNCSQTDWVHVGSGSHRKTETVPPEAQIIFKTFLEKKDLDGFLIRIIDSNPTDLTEFWLSNVVLNIFNTWIEFDIWLSIQDEKRWVNLQEFKSFFNALKANEYNSIEFSFKKMKVKERLSIKYG